MIILPGNAVPCCEGSSRREWLRVGGLSALGLSLPELTAGRAQAQAARVNQARAASFGRAKSCIVLFMFGAPAHQDLWDLKPHAPAGVRGEFQPIASNVPAIHVGEHLPRLSQRMDRLAQIRSVTHPDNTHTVAMHYMLTGTRHIRPATNPQNAPDDFPCFGAMMNFAARQSWPSVRQSASRRAKGFPPAVSLNAPANQVSANNHIFPGFFGGFLGTGCDPLFVAQNANAERFQPLPTVENADRLTERRRLLDSIDQRSFSADRVQSTNGLAAEYERAFDVLTTPAVRSAFALDQEPPELRDAYGRTPFGQGCLLARRLVERGVSLVTVNWERDDAFWDTHKNNFADLKTRLLPNMDRGFSALLDDLAQRGLLDETLIVWLGEFGRTPQINANAGRDHWAACNTVLLSGAGVPGGTVYGSSDRLAAWPASNPVTPQDLSATIYHLLGIDHHQTIRDSLQRPFALSTGEPLGEVL